MRQGDCCGALQRCVYSQLTEAVVDTWYLAVHGPARDDAHLRSKAEIIAAFVKQRHVGTNR